jgi:hypothetical protein
MRNMIIYLKRISILSCILLLPVVLLLSTSALAQEEGAKGEKKKTLSFEDELVEGATQKPELFYLFQKKNFNYKRLIKLRENFLPEMRKTSEDLQRVRSSN